MKTKDAAITGGLLLLGLWLWNRSQNNGGEISGGGGGVASGSEDIAATPVYNQVPYSGGNNGYTSDNSIINSNGKPIRTLADWQASELAYKKANTFFPGATTGKGAVTANPFINMPLSQRIPAGILTGGISEVARMATEAAQTKVSLPWWAAIFPPVTYPLALAQATHANDAQAATSAESGHQWTRTPGPAYQNFPLNNTSKSAGLAAAGVRTPRTDLTTLYGPIMAKFSAYTPTRANFAPLSSMPTVNIYGNPLRESALKSNLVKAGKISAYDAYGGAAAFIQSRAQVEFESDIFYSGAGKKSKNTTQKANPGSATNLKNNIIAKATPAPKKGGSSGSTKRK